MFISLSRAINYGLQNFWRNLGLSLTTVTILVLTLLSVNVLYAVNVLTREAVRVVADQVDVSIYFKTGVAATDAAEVETYLKTFKEVTYTKLLTPDEALVQFKERHKDEPAVLESINALDENPLPITLIVKTASPGDYKKILGDLDVAEYKNLIESKTYDDHSYIIGRINLITERIKYLAAMVSIVFTVIAFLIIFNAIRVAIYSQREEISIKKLVGATNWFIRGPFLFDGFLYALLSVVFSMVVVFVSLRLLDGYVGAIFANGFSMTREFTRDAFRVFGLQFLAVLILVGLSSAMAMRKHLRV